MSSASPLSRSNETTTQKSGYRPELDGLRAFAVIAVIINHFRPELLPGGYLGVDIFFVISGYVITSSLANSKPRNFQEFISAFYQRRIKRLLPALITYVLTASTFICMVNPNPGRYLEAGFYSLFGASNIFLFRDATDYFAQTTELNPFTHTWSLGVEEQFYLIYPLLIWYSGLPRNNRAGSRRSIFTCLCILATSSLVGFIYLYQINQPAAYFLMPTRFWELATGCLAFLGPQHYPKTASALAKTPALLIAGTIASAMLLPVQMATAGTILIVTLSAILITCVNEQGAGYKILTHRIMRHLGLISYSLYLWHWGVLALSRWTIGITPWTAPFQLGLIYLLALVSYKLIETPFRRGSQNTPPYATISLAAFALCMSATTMLAINAKRTSLFLGDSSILDDNRLYRSLNLNGSRGQRLIALGDSHTGAIGALLVDLNRLDGFSIKMHARGAGLADINEKDPNEFILKALRTYEASLSRNDTIIITMNYMYSGPDEAPYLSAIEKAVETAQSKQAKLILLRPIPYFKHLRPYRECYTAWFRPTSNRPDHCTETRPRSQFIKQFKRVIEAQDQLATIYPNTVYILDSFSTLCPATFTTCRSYSEAGRNLFKDRDHISSYAARTMRPRLLELLEAIDHKEALHS